MRFGFVYTAQGMVVYDLCRDDGAERETWVATLSADPRVHFAAASPELALSRLLAHLGIEALNPACPPGAAYRGVKAIRS